MQDAHSVGGDVSHYTLSNDDELLIKLLTGVRTYIDVLLTVGFGKLF
jgi:hypothetical protein